MADPNLKVVIGAQIEGLLAGLKEAEHAIEHFREPVDELIRSLKEIGEATGIAFAVEKIADWISEAAEAGEHAVNLGAALNLSAEAANNLGGMMSIVGANADTAIRLFGQLSRAIDEAISRPSSRRAFAFEEAGIDPEHLRQVLSGPNGVINAIEELGDAFDRLKRSGGDTGVTGPLGVILGTRTFAEIDKLISKGKEFREALKEIWESTAPPSDTALEALDHLAEQFHTLTGAIENFGKAITTSIAGPLGALTEWATGIIAKFTKLVQLSESMPWAQEPSAAAPIPELIPGATAEEMNRLAAIRQRESRGDYEAKNRESTASGAYQMIDETWRRWAAAVGIDTSKYPTARSAPAAMQDMAALHGLRTEGEAPWAASAGREGAGAPGGAGGITRFDQFTKDKAAYEALQKSIEEGGAREIADVEHQIALAKQRGDSLEREKFLYADLEAAKVRMYEAEDHAAAEFQAKYGQRADEVVGKYKNHDAQKIAADTAFIGESTRLSQQQVQAEVELLNTKIKNLNQSESEELKQTNRLQQLHQMNATDAQQKELQIVEAHRKAVNEILQQELGLAQAIPALRARINAQVEANDLAAAQQSKTINDKFEDDRLKKAQEINQTIARDFSSSFMQVITGHETITQAFAQLGEKLGQTLIEKITEKFLESSIFGAGGFGGLLGGLPLIGSLFGARGGWVVPSFQSGGILSMLHQNEMVLPSHISQGFQDMFAGRSGGIGGPTINIHAIDTQSGAQFLMQHGPSIANAWRSGGMYGNLSPRSISSGGRFP